ncbi:EscU/YscU/HrcU family type III secretion system export apparatus switch protein [Niallia sp. MER TA 168]|uniref:EscU/YscU/HrcU family type III secretion system export apparatus switch protein n=1 Tax=Niallia sp. MER TA 168 TaxID=2939568 RepID=UPI00203F2E63|nr:EscU/YscU/HrcU family type III secretion system export apparatus switch protein [Niallia sp. MER TA 168]MCM3361509.1 EscU/YscU/HrcU family type III secretion system export apparatus switch protein [Niallia sp. MER TA 168]
MNKPKSLKRKEAIALTYEQHKYSAPAVIAKGKGLVAEQILERAKKENIPIQEDASLVELLSKLNINEQIPEDLYMAVAEVFAYIYSLEKETAKKDAPKGKK